MSESALRPIEFRGDYIHGSFQQSTDSDGDWNVISPGDLSDRVFEPSFSLAHIGDACLAAKEAYKKWRNTTFEERAEALQRLKEIYLVRADDLAQTISRETGKPLWEAKTEAKAMASKIDITLNDSMKRISEQRLENALPNVTGVTRYKSRGVMAVIGPFNFPGHLPNGHIVPALAAGNTIVFKPSDKTPAVGQLMAEMFDEAGFPPGVFNLLQGQGETGKRLVTSEHIDGILFTGSYEVGLKIKQQTLQDYWKILALEMGGKNATIVWKDANLKKAVYETLIGAYLTAGQRCSCTSRILLHEDIYDEFLDNFYKAAKKITIGHWSEEVFMGPLISAESQDKYFRFQEIGKREGAESLMRGKALDVGKPGYYVTPSINLIQSFSRESVYQKSEIFGPNVGVYKINDFDQAMEITNSTGFGLVMALFTKDQNLYEKALIEAKVGLLNLNRTTNGASSKMPFGGMGKSGNDRPSGHFAVDYCVVPVASLEDPNDFDPQKIMPGLNFQYGSDS